ncbi:MAG: hypothetical protein IGQ45_05485 [Cyanobacterium sp. T60_A2020_053]|nr:hypothetical protein [Cyanobacterium sp. T60_A2020_053]
MNKLFLTKLLIHIGGLTARNQKSGFALIEVLVTILVVTGFILGSLQAVVLSTVLRVQAQDKNEALNWIQQDLELIRFQAFNLYRNSDPVNDPGGKYADTGCSTKDHGSRLLNDPTNGLLQPTTPRFFGVQTTPTLNDRDPNSPKINDKEYWIYRQYNPTGNTLGITHTVLYSSNHPRYVNTTSIAINNTNPNYVTTLSTEVIPNAALDCP